MPYVPQYAICTALSMVIFLLLTFYYNTMPEVPTHVIGTTALCRRYNHSIPCIPPHYVIGTSTLCRWHHHTIPCLPSRYAMDITTLCLRYYHICHMCHLTMPWVHHIPQVSPHYAIGTIVFFHMYHCTVP